ncbi:MAG: 2-oxo-4-hydroxy-4-carboxy-5-ureidoimidazoline decarboxylase [Telmatospirillum sp.]|nr:2-oxo-4-hydroxy-4-carboxy-5-ureidoimidazoline decarboxylase [Telmatospirillum sp.]
MTARISLDTVNDLPDAAFTEQFAGIYEQSPWVAQGAAAARPFSSVTALAAAMAAVVAAADGDRQRDLLRAHPDLAGRAALRGELTPSSQSEQAAAGLDSLTPDEMERFQRANRDYRDRFGFPFILAVRHWGKSHILAAYEGRLGNSLAAERAHALAEVDKIAFSRLLALVVPAATGRLTTHVLDTARGCPAAGLPVTLERIRGGTAAVIRQDRTNADGRLDAPLLEGAEMEPGLWCLQFAAGDYFLASGQPLTAPSFLDLVPVRFAIANPERHYHVPLLLSPWSYSTYRGS